jgi:hypothetical protein
LPKQHTVTVTVTVTVTDLQFVFVSPADRFSAVRALAVHRGRVSPRQAGQQGPAGDGTAPPLQETQGELHGAFGFERDAGLRPGSCSGTCGTSATRDWSRSDLGDRKPQRPLNPASQARPAPRGVRLAQIAIDLLALALTTGLFSELPTRLARPLDGHRRHNGPRVRQGCAWGAWGAAHEARMGHTMPRCTHGAAREMAKRRCTGPWFARRLHGAMAVCMFGGR